MYKDKSQHRKWLIREIKDIRKQIVKCRSEYQLTHTSPDSPTAEAYQLVLIAVDNLIDYYDPEFEIQNLLQLELEQRINAQFKKE